MFWPSIGADKLCPQELYKYAYCVSHDHNFNFMSVGYFGPGYRSKFFSSDRGFNEAKSGDVFTMEYLDEFVLNKGDVIVVSEYSDVHIQYPPDSLSITLNLIPKQKYRFKQAFVEENGKVLAPMENSSHFMFFNELAEQFSGEYYTELLAKLYA